MLLQLRSPKKRDHFKHFSTLLDQGFDMDRSTPATQIDGGNGN